MLLKNQLLTRLSKTADLQYEHLRSFAKKEELHGAAPNQEEKVGLNPVSLKLNSVGLLRKVRTRSDLLPRDIFQCVSINTHQSCVLCADHLFY